MALDVIGAGLPRTGTTSLKAALERLLDARCYHMFELHGDVEVAGPLWWQALEGDHEALVKVLEPFRAAIDWPSSLFWRELLELYPDALVVLSHRGDADTWWTSVDKTVWASMRRDTSDVIGEFNKKMRAKAGLGDDWAAKEAAVAMYESLYNEVVETVPADRLLIWQPSDGWAPLCKALDVPLVKDDFVHLNTTATFRERANLNDGAQSVEGHCC